MTTATDWDPGTWTDTGEHALVTDVTSAPTETPWLPDVPGHIHDDLCRTMPPGEYAAAPAPLDETTAMHMPLRLDRTDARDEYGRLCAVYDATRQDAQDWRDLAFAAEQRQQEQGPQHRDVASPLVAAYEAERDRLIRGLSGPEYGGHTYDDERGFVPTGAPERHDPPQREPEPEESKSIEYPDDRADAIEAAEAGEHAAPWWRGSVVANWLRRRGEVAVAIAIGVVALYVGVIAMAVVLA